MNTPNSYPLAPAPMPSKWQPFKDAFHDYAKWLVSISWKLFAAISLVAMMAGGLLLIPQFTALLILTSNTSGRKSHRGNLLGRSRTTQASIG